MATIALTAAATVGARSLGLTVLATAAHAATRISAGFVGQQLDN